MGQKPSCQTETDIYNRAVTVSSCTPNEGPMKIVCDACQASTDSGRKGPGRPSRSDARKCNHIIVVRSSGERAVGAAAEPKPAAAEAQGTWYVVVEGEQMGPLAETDIAARLRRGEITGESLVWKEGLPTG